MFSTIRFKAYLFVSFFAATLLLQGIMQHLQAERVHEQSVYLANTQSAIMTHLHEMQLAVIQVQQRLTDISATRGMDGLNDGFEKAAKSVELFQTSVKTLQRIDTKFGFNYLTLLPLMDDYYVVGQKMAHAYVDDGAHAGNEIKGEFDITASALFGKVAELSKQLNNKADEQFAIELESTESAQNVNVIFFCIFAILLLIMLFGMHRFVLKPVHNIVEMAQNLVNGEGDLTQRLPIKGRDELAQLAQAFNEFIEHTDNLVSQVTKSVIRLVPMAKELSQTNNSIEQAATEQRERSLQVGNSMEETTESAKEVTLRIQQISNSVKESVGTLNDGQHVAQQTMQGMDQLSLEITLISEAIVKLRTDSEKIESIIDVINAISEQTNLLALNAAIEAARAGDAGRGFAVVADEVRTLATRTKDATVEVQKMILSIQSGAQQASETMQKGMSSAQYSVTQVNKSADVLKGLTLVMNEIDSQSNEIQQETEKQNHHFDSVTDSIHLMESEFNNTLEHLSSSLEFGNDLNKLSDKLRNLIEKIKVTDTDYSAASRAKRRTS